MADPEKKAAGKNASGWAVMDKAWENIQKKTFTKWVNSHLAKRAKKIEEITTDFGDGLLLLAFLEVISGKYFAKFEKNPKIRIQKIQNLDLALKFIKEQGVNLIAIGPEDIADGNLKLILGMIWTIIQKFQIDDISEEELSAKEALLLWCKKKTAGYRDVKVENFHTSWQDGMAFCALIHKHRPDLIDFDSLKKENSKENMKLAFEVAEKELGIPQLLDVEDMVDVVKPDERSVITYVVQYYHAFSASRKQEVAARRVGRLVDFASSAEQMQNDYNTKAKQLVEWIEAKSVEMKDRNFPNNLEGVSKLLSELIDYKNNTKPDKDAEKVALETLFNAIQMKLRSNNRPAFVPEKGHSPSEIDHKWNDLSKEERDREDALRRELERQEKLDLLNKRFNNKFDKLQQWIQAKEKYLQTDEHVDSLNAAKGKIKTHEAFYDEYASSKSRLTEVQDIVKEILELDPNNSEIQSRVNKLSDQWNGLQGQADTKKADLHRKLEIQEKMEQLRIDWAKLVKEYNRWAGEAIDTLNDHTFGDTLEAVEAFKSELDSGNQSYKTQSEEKKASLENTWNEMQSLGITDLKYTVLTVKDVETRHNAVLDAIKRREEAYVAELERQQLLEAKRKEYAQLAQQFIEHLEQRKQHIQSLLSQNIDTEALINNIKQEYNDGQPEKEKLDALLKFSNEMSALGINSNKHTEYNHTILSNKNAGLGNAVKNYIAALQDEQEQKAQYIERAQSLLDWINQTLPTLQERSFDNTLAGAQNQSNLFSAYKTGKKAEVTASRPEIERVFTSIQSLLQKNKRPEWAPPSGLSLEDIQKAWSQLEEEEKKKEADVRQELARQEKLAILVRRFNSDASDLESWISTKEAYLQQRESIDTLFSAKFNLSLYEAYNEEFNQRQSSVQSLNTLKDEIASLNYNDIASVESKAAKIQELIENLNKLAAEKDTYLQEQFEVQSKKENLRLDFARLAKDYSLWAKETSEDVAEYNFGFTLDAVTAYKADLDKSDEQLKAAEQEKLAAIEAVNQQIQDASITDNRHTKITFENIKTIHDQFLEELTKRQEAYAKELEKQKLWEDKRKEFAAQAQKVVDFLAQERASLEHLEGNPDEVIAKINDIHKDGADAKQLIDQLVALSTEMQSLGIYNNPHTVHTLPSINSRNNQQNVYVKNLIAAATEEQELAERIKQQESELAEKEKIENLVIEFSKKARELNAFMESAEDFLGDPITATSVQDAEKLIAAFNQFETQFQARTNDHTALVAQANSMKEAGVTDFSGISIEDITAKFNTIATATEERKKAVHDELERQKSNDSLCHAFADSANDFSQFIQQQKEQVAAVKGELEEQREAVAAIQRDYQTSGKDRLNALEAINQRAQTAGIKNNPYTQFTVRSLEVQYNELNEGMNKQLKLLDSEILQKKNADVTPEQLEEFKQTFRHFDKDHSGFLNRHEFKACLQTLGDDTSDSELDKIINTIGKDGKIGFEAFTKFMVDRNKDSTTSDEILESFKSLANDKDFVTADDLRKVMSNDHVAFLLARMPQYESVPNAYDYKKWIQKVYSS